MKYKVVLFDADGVTLKEGQRFSEFYSKKHNIPLSRITPFFTGPFQACLVGKADVKEELAAVAKEWGWQSSVDELMNLWFSSCFELSSEVAEAIQKLRANHVRCFLVTNQEKYRGQYLREKLHNLFDDVFVSGDIGYKKNEPQFFEYVYSHMKRALKKSDILLVDDDIENIEAAKRFGLTTIHYQNTSDLLEIFSA